VHQERWFSCFTLLTSYFDGTTPNLQGVLQIFKDEFYLWQISGAKGLTALSHEGAVAAV